MDKLTRVSHEYKLSLWTDRIKECRASGLTVSKWCEQNNIGAKTYYYWMRKIKREVFENLSEGITQNSLVPTDSKPPVFSKLELNTVDPLRSEVAVTIRLNDISIDVCSGATEMVIRNAILAIQSIYPENTRC